MGSSFPCPYSVRQLSDISQHIHQSCPSSGNEMGTQTSLCSLTTSQVLPSAKLELCKVSGTGRGSFAPPLFSPLQGNSKAGKKPSRNPIQDVFQQVKTKNRSVHGCQEILRKTDPPLFETVVMRTCIAMSGLHPVQLVDFIRNEPLGEVHQNLSQSCQTSEQENLMRKILVFPAEPGRTQPV